MYRTSQDSKKVTYKTIHKLLSPDKTAQFNFERIRGKQKEGEDPEKNTFAELKFYHAVKDACEKYPDTWQEIENNTELFDQIGTILTENKDDKTLSQQLQTLNLPEAINKELMALSFSGFGHLSFKALHKITPHILNGLTYDKAVEAAYPGEFAEKLSGDKNLLPPLSEDQLHQLTNPVVKRAISQTRKVVNAIIQKYGAPYQIKVETARDLAKNFKDRRDIEKSQQENQARNEQAKKHLHELGNINPSGQQIIKYKLYEQQAGKCAYCGAPLTIADDSQTEVDHIIPFSRCGNDSFYNKVLVCPKCNQDKADRTPYEKWGHDAKRWPVIEAQAVNLPDPKKDRILCVVPPKEEWRDHALNDTRYISKFLMKYFKENLKFADDAKCKQRVVSPSGRITDYLRKIYGIGGKDRSLNNCHHAADACVIATMTEDQVRKVSIWNKYKELGANTHTVLYIDDDGSTKQVTTTDYENIHGMLEPWGGFAKEVRIRTGMSYDSGKIENLADFRDKFRQFKTYDDEFLRTIHPLFVSRMAKHSMKGSAHEKTLRSPRTKNRVLRLSRKPLDKDFAKNYLKNPAKSWLENSVLAESDQVLYQQLKKNTQRKRRKGFRRTYL